MTRTFSPAITCLPLAILAASGCQGAIDAAAVEEHPAALEVSDGDGPARLDLAIIGDSPYGPDQLVDFPNLVAHISGYPMVKGTVHLGDIKNGSSRCDTSYFETVFEQIDGFLAPFILTPGDNEWTDCHRASNGAYDPLERLSVLRQMFYPEPGRALGGHHKKVLSQAFIPGFEAFVENQLWFQSKVAFGAVHVVGSNNGLLPWFGDDTTGTKHDDPERRQAEVAARIAAGVDWLQRLFAMAEEKDARGVVVMMQADTWTGGARDGFTAIVRTLADLARAFARPVLLLQGDTHVYKTDSPLAAGDAGYGVTEPVPNLTRVVVQGATTSEWLLLQIEPEGKDGPLFGWQRIFR